MPHTCSWYCTGEVHAIRVLRRHADDETHIAADYQALGFDVVRVRPVVEVDLAAWRARMTHTLQDNNGTPTRVRGTTPALLDCRYAYLLWLRRGAPAAAPRAGSPS
jgi:hypothetical protein